MQVDLVRKGSYLLLVFKEDKYYPSLYPPKDREKTIDDLANHKKNLAKDGVVKLLPPDAYETWDIGADPYHFMIAWYALRYKEFLLCDIGAHIGKTAMDATKTAWSVGGRPKIFAFDCGVASALTWRNFQNNGFGEIRFVEAAVGPVDGHAVMYRVEGFSFDNKLINPTGDAVPVECLKIDTFFERNGLSGPACIKIDTQGAEPGVIAGMEQTLRAGPITMQLELTPWAMRKNKVNPVLFVESIINTHHLFILGHANNKFLRMNTARDVVINADKGHPHWSDVLAIPRNLEGVDQILDRFESAYKGTFVPDPLAS